MENEKLKMENYKQTELGLIPEDWEVKKLGELGKIINGLTYSPENIKENGTLVLRSSNVQNDKIVYVDNVFVEENISFNPTKKDDVLICVRNGSRGLIGKTALIDEQASNVAFGAFMAIYRSNSNNYIYNYFKSNYFFKEVHKNLGATINSINNNDLKKFKIPLPPLSEQKKIADCLSTWDSAIEKQNALINALIDRKKALMQQLLTGKKRLPGFEGEWKEVKLGEVINISSSKRVLEEDWKNEGIPFYRTREIINLSNNEVFKSPIFITEELYENLKKKYGVPKTGDILATGVGTIGETYIVEDNDKFYFKDGNVIWFKMNKSINSYFLKYQFKTRFIKKQLMDNASITTVATFTIEGAKNTKIILPTLSEQTAIAEILATADRELTLQKEKLAQLQTQKKGLMQVLLTGKKRLIN